MRRLATSILLNLLFVVGVSAQTTTFPPQPGGGGGSFSGGTITSPILAVANECATVPYSFTGWTTTGLGHATLTDSLYLCTGGIRRMGLTASQNVMDQQVLLIPGSAATPSAAFSGATTTGVYGTTTAYGISVGGVERVSVGTIAATSTVRLRGPAGTDDNVTYGSTASSPVGQAGMYFPTSTSVRVKSNSIASSQAYFESTSTGGEIARISAGTLRTVFQVNGNTDEATVDVAGTTRGTWSTTSFASTLRIQAPTFDLADGGAKPACTSITRGYFWMDEGGAGVADTVEVCSKDAADVYAWRTLIP